MVRPLRLLPTGSILMNTAVTGEVPRKPLLRSWVKALPLAPRQSVHVQTGQGNGAAGSSRLQGFEFVQSLVEPSGEMSLVSGNLLQGLLVGKQALSTHPLEIPLYLLRRL